MSEKALMEEYLAKQKEENDRKSRLMSEDEYLDTSVKYALSCGWVKEDQKELLIEKYLKPIHQHYLEIIDDLRTQNVPPEELAVITRYLNYCLESTKRIGSTDHQNIHRSIADYRDRFGVDDFQEYALTSMLEFVDKIIF